MKLYTITRVILPIAYKSYPIEIPREEIEFHSCCWKTEVTIWRHIGSVDSLKAARYMVENDRISYKDADGVCYYLECEPDDECYYCFVKIEYGDTIEYYDSYVPGKEHRYGRRKSLN